MLKRIFAWLLIAGFVFLILNILVIGWYSEYSAIAYAAIAVVYFISMKWKGNE